MTELFHMSEFISLRFGSPDSTQLLRPSGDSGSTVLSHTSFLHVSLFRNFQTSIQINTEVDSLLVVYISLFGWFPVLFCRLTNFFFQGSRVCSSFSKHKDSRTTFRHLPHCKGPVVHESSYNEVLTSFNRDLFSDQRLFRIFSSKLSLTRVH